jgi:NADPH:quinone reductase-like Zn-dependent oxidoreductase
MKAIISNRYGTSDVLQFGELPNPIPGDKDLLIKIYAGTVNRTDCGFLTGEPKIARLLSGLSKPRVKVLGNEFAGLVEAVGKLVTSFKVGDNVFGYNDSTFGAHAEYICINENRSLALIPSTMTYEEAAPLTEAAHYALCDLRAANISKGQSVLVNGATGAIGSAAVQLAHYFGATVTAVCAGKHVSLIKSLGAVEVIDYTQQDFTQLSQQLDLVFDAVGKSSFGKCKPLLKKKGIYVSTELGTGGENVWLSMIKKFGTGKRIIFPIPSINKKDVEFLGQLAANGHFKPLIDRHYVLEEIAAAYDYALTGEKIGNLVLRIAK